MIQREKRKRANKMEKWYPRFKIKVEISPNLTGDQLYCV